MEDQSTLALDIHFLLLLYAEDDNENGPIHAEHVAEIPLCPIVSRYSVPVGIFVLGTDSCTIGTPNELFVVSHNRYKLLQIKPFQICETDYPYHLNNCQQKQ